MRAMSSGRSRLEGLAYTGHARGEFTTREISRVVATARHVERVGAAARGHARGYSRRSH